MNLTSVTKTMALCLLGSGLVVASCKKEGCTDPDANNYKKKATVDDGSCTYDEGVVTAIYDEHISTETVISSGKTVEFCGDLDITAGLIIEPGATLIMCADTYLDVMDAGYIKCEGTAADPIIIKGETSTPGYWGGIRIGSNNPNNSFKYTTIQDAGTYWAWEYANVYVDNGGKLSIENSTISNSEKHGLVIQNGATIGTFSGNTFSNNAETGLMITSAQVHKMSGNSVLTGNGNAFIDVLDDDLGTNVTWKATTAPLLINGNIRVSGGLTLSAGLDLWMEAGSAITVESTGYLTAQGTATNHITIQGRYSSAGYWDHLYIESNNPNNKFNYVDITDGGGYWLYSHAGVNVDGTLEINNSSITNSNSWGMVVGSSSTIKTNGVVVTDAAGVSVNNNLSGNGMGADADCSAGGCTILFE